MTAGEGSQHVQLNGRNRRAAWPPRKPGRVTTFPGPAGGVGAGTSRGAHDYRMDSSRAAASSALTFYLWNPTCLPIQPLLNRSAFCV